MALSRLRAFAAAGSFALFSGSAAGSRGVQAALQLQRAVTDDVATSLQRQGFAVLDGVFTPDLCDVLRDEISGLRGSPLLHPNATHLVRDGATHLLEKQSIWEAEILSSEVQEKAPTLGAIQNDSTLITMLNLVLPQLNVSSQALKAQLNSGGGSFPIHHDSDELLDGRCITAIFYLNPTWRPGDGGELRVYPFPLAGPIDIPPLGGRAVLFSSTQMPHRVLPTSRGYERYCFTSWLSQARRRAAQPKLAGNGDLTAAGAAEFLMQPHVRKHLVKFLYGDEWSRSLEDSHPPGRARDQVLATHMEEVQMIADRLQPRLRIALGDDCPDRRLTSGDAEALKLAIMRMHSDPGIPGGIRWL